MAPESLTLTPSTRATLSVVDIDPRESRVNHRGTGVIADNVLLLDCCCEPYKRLIICSRARELSYRDAEHLAGAAVLAIAS
eukprot:2182883-Amphidinium_carterae.1